MAAHKSATYPWSSTDTSQPAHLGLHSSNTCMTADMIDSACSLRIAEYMNTAASCTPGRLGLGGSFGRPPANGNCGVAGGAPAAGSPSTGPWGLPAAAAAPEPLHVMPAGAGVGGSRLRPASTADLAPSHGSASVGVSGGWAVALLLGPAGGLRGWGQARITRPTCSRNVALIVPARISKS